MVTSAVKRGLYWRKLVEEVALHSDRGSQSDSSELQSLAKEQNLLLNMGYTGSCYYNVVTEIFFLYIENRTNLFSQIHQL